MSKKKVDETPQVRQLKPRTANQAKYIRAICESDIVLCTGYPGTGKTACAARLACEWLIEGKIKKILLTRPLIDAGEKGFGFLPGELIEKISPYLTPVLDEISEYFSDVEIRKMVRDKIILPQPLELLRGRNFHETFMLLDESENASYDQIKMFLTRIGKDSKCVINGDIKQCDLRPEKSGGMVRCIEKLRGVEGVSVIEFTRQDIVRSSIVGRVLDALEA